MESSKRNFRIFLFVVILGFGVVIYFFNQTPSLDVPAATGRVAEVQTARVGTNQGDTAPPFTLTTIDGRSVSLSDFKGNKPVLLYFGATWCPNCRRDLAEVKPIYEEYKDRVEFLSVGVDVRESSKVWSNYQQNMGLSSLTFAPGTSSVVRDYGVRYTTSKFGIDRNGTVVFSSVGAVSSADWRRMFETLAQ